MADFNILVVDTTGGPAARHPKQSSQTTFDFKSVRIGSSLFHIQEVGGKLDLGGAPLTNFSDSLVIGDLLTPSLITAAGGIVLPSAAKRTLVFVAGNGGPVTITAGTQITPPSGVQVFDEVTVAGVAASDTNWVELNNGTGLIQNGLCRIIDGSSITYYYDGAVYREKCRNDI